MKHRRSRRWIKREEQLVSFFVSEREEEDVKEKGRKRNKSPRAKQFLEKSGRWLFFLLILMRNCFCVDAAAGRLEPKEEAEVPETIIASDAVEGILVNLDGGSFQTEQKEKHQRNWKWTQGVDRTEMRKEEKRLRCALLNGSAWSTERKNIRRYKGTFDAFFGIEHRLRKEEMKEQFNREAKEGWRFAASAARITEEMAGDEDRKHTSGGVWVANDSNLGAVVGAEKGTFESIPGLGERERRSAYLLSHFLHSEGWSRNEALLEWKQF